jgi:hypothetical protein
MSPKTGQQISKSKGERSAIVHTRVTPGTHNRLLVLAYENGWTLSTAINAVIENGLDALEQELAWREQYEAQEQQAKDEVEAYEKQQEEQRKAREKYANDFVKQLQKQGKLKK